jgi:predicted nucleotidyltransferase
MKTLKEIKSILMAHKNEIEKKFKVEEIGIFGSYVKGEQNEKSDLDILVKFKEPVGLFEFLELEEYISNLLGIKVDLVSKKALKPKIGEYILKEVFYL